MIPRLQKVDAIGGDAINHPMLSRDPSAPATGEFVLQRLGFAYSAEWIGNNCLHEFQRLQRCLSIVPDPPGEVFAKLWQEVDSPLRILAHRRGNPPTSE